MEKTEETEDVYKVANSDIVAQNLSSILFKEEFADVVIIAGGQGGSP